MFLYKNIVLGITGSIAAYKSADLTRRLREAGATVYVVMTENAKQFITPLTMQAVSGFPVHDELFDIHAEAAMGHIELAKWADLILIAPASADFLSRLAMGAANDLLTSICLATSGKIVAAPAMNQLMWKNSLTQDNLQKLQNKNITILDTGYGSQACGDVGPGRMLEPTIIVDKIAEIFSNDLLAGLRILITAGPTQEAIDPVRYISNRSSGKMGFAIANAAKAAGAQVTVISGPTQLKLPKNIQVENVISAREMQVAVMKHIHACDIFISAAAVGDYRVEEIAKHKLAKTAENLQLTLIRNPDIISEVKKLPEKPYIIGFAAETEDLIAKARQKKKQKNMDMIIANQVGKDVGFESDENAVTIIVDNQEITLEKRTKTQLARDIVALLSKTTAIQSRRRKA